MKKSRGLLMIRFFALLIAVMLLLGSVPISAVIEQVEDSESASGVTETEETQAPSDEGDGDPAEAPQEDGGADDTQSEPTPVTSAPPVLVTAEKPDPVKEIEGQEIAPDVYFNYNADASLMVSGYDNVGIYKGLSVIEITYSGFDVTNPGEKARVVVTSIDDTTMPENFDEPNGTWGLQTDFVSQSFNSEQGKTTYTIYAQTAASMLLSKKDGTEGLRVWYTNDKYGTGNKLTYSDLLFYIDDEGPVVTVDEDAVDSTKWYRYSVTFPFTVEDAAGTLFAYISADKGDVFPDDDSNTVYTVEVTETPFTITAYDNLGNESTTTISKTVKIDEEEPQLTLVKNTETWGDTQTFIVSATDDGEIDPDSFKIDGNAVTASHIKDDEYEITTGTGGNLTVKDLSGRTSEALELTMNVDATPVTANDVSLKFFVRSEEEQLAIEGIEDTFKIHFNTVFSNAENVTMRVIVSRNGGSPITTITAENNNTPLDPVDDIKTLADGRDYRDFKIDLTDENSDLKSYGMLRYEIKDTTAAKATTVGISYINTVYAQEDQLPDPIDRVVNTKIKPEVTADTSTGGAVNVDEKLYAKKNAKLNVNIDDKIAHLYRLRVFFDSADKFDAENGYKPAADANNITADAIPEAQKSLFDEKENGVYEYNDADDPLNSLKLSCTVPEAAAGRYILYIEAQNYSRNISVFTEEVYIDNDGPVITDVKYSKDWTNHPIELKFKVADKPDTDAVGVDKVTVNGTTVTPQDGEYVFSMTGRKTYVISASDKLGNKATSVTINRNEVTFDDIAPSVTSVDYDQSVTNAAVVVTAAASDDLSGVAAVYAENIADPTKQVSGVFDNEANAYKMTINENGVNEWRIFAVDKAGNVTPAASAPTATTSIDTSGISVRRVSFKDIVTGTAHGVYSNKNIQMAVMLDQTGVAVLASAKMNDQEGELSTDKLTASFVLPVETKVENILNVTFTLTNTAGTTVTKTLKDLLATSGEIYLSEEVKGDKDLFEIIATNTKSTISDIEYTFEKSETVGDDYYTNGVGGKFEFTVTDDLSGIDLNQIKVMFGVAGSMQDVTASLVEENRKTDAALNKVTEVQYAYTPDTALASGKYQITVNEKNNAGNAADAKSFGFYVDADAPVISNVSYSSEWTNAPIELTFDAADAPAKNSIGIEKVTVNGLEITPTDGKYVYSMTGRKTYVIGAVDKFGNKAASVTINHQDVPFDNTAPVVVSTDYSDALSNSKVPVKVKVSDDLSGVKQVYAENINDPADKVSVEADQEGQTEFTLNFSTQGENEYRIYAVDSATNITDLANSKTVKIRIDNSPITISKVVFKNYKTGTEHGVYSNTDMYMHVTVSNDGLAVLKTANMLIDDQSEDPIGYPVALSPDHLTAVFMLPINPDGTMIENLLEKRIMLENTAGTSVDMTFAELLEQTAEIYVSDEIKGNKELFEIIATKATSNISDINCSFEKSTEVGGAYYSNGVNGDFGFTITDELSGVDLNSVKITLAKEGNVSIITDSFEREVLNDTYDKATEVEYTYKMPERLTSGYYSMTVEEKNLAGNITHRSFNFYVDATLPEITDVVYSDKWTNAPIELTFTVTDKPAENAVGISEVTVNGETVTGTDGKYTFLMTERKAYEIKAVDKVGNETSLTIENYKVAFDNVAPSVDSVSYNTAETDSDVIVTVNASDDLSGVKQVYAENIKDAADKVIVDADQEGQTQFQITISSEGDNEYKIYAVDAAGNVTAVKNAKPVHTKIDKSDIKVARVSFENIVNGTPFGVYSGGFIMMHVTVEKPGIAVLKSAKLNSYSVTLSSDRLTAIFKLPVETDIDNILDNVFTFEKTTGRTVTLSLKQLLSETAEIYVKKDAEGNDIYGNTELFEIIATTAKSNITPIEPTFKGSADVNGTYYCDGADGKFEFTITDELSGINKNSVVIKFGETNKLNDITSKVASSVTKDAYDKITEIKYTYTLTERLATGYYTFSVNENNLAGNSAKRTLRFYVDASEPVISGETYSTVWTNKPIKLEFKVDERPEENAIGLDTVTVNDEPISEVSSGKKGRYTYSMTERKAYVIKATDKFGNQSTSTIPVEDVYFDNTAPIVHTATCVPSEQTNTDIEVTVNTSDDLSGVKQVYAENINDPSDVVVVNAETEGQTEFKLTISAEGKLNYRVYAVDNAGNVTAVDDAAPITTEIDKSDIKVAKITFDGIVTGTALGVYSNQSIKMAVTVAKPGIAVLKSAKMNGYAVELSEDKLTATFTLPVETKLENILNNEFTFENTAGTVSTKSLKELLWDNAEIIVGDGIKNNKKLLEIIATNASSSISEIAPDFKQSTDRGGVYYTDGANGKFEFTITDALSGIDTDKVSVTFDRAEEANPADVTAQIVTEEPTTDVYDKVTELNCSLTLTERLETGYYTITVKEKNLAGNPAEQSFSFYVDASAPAISEPTYTVGGSAFDNSVWTKDPITVHFTVTEQPNANFIGVYNMKATGDTTGTEYELYTSTEDGRTYTCSFEVKYNESVTIEADDMFHNTAAPVKTDILKYDEDKPNISKFRYRNGEKESENINDIDWATAENGIVVSFDIDDLSKNHVGNTAQKDDDRATLSDLNTASVKVKANQLREDNPVPAGDIPVSFTKDGDVYHFTFTAQYYANYTVTFEDYAENGNSATTATVKVDKEKPSFTNVVVKSHNSQGGEILRLLTFGLYSNEDITMTVSAQDVSPSSGIREITATVNGEEVKAHDIHLAPSEADPDAATAVVTGDVTFTISRKTLTNDRNIIFTVTDNAGNTYEASLETLRKASLTEALTKEIKGLLGIYDGDEYPDDGFEVVSTDEKPHISSQIDLSGEGVFTDVYGNRWFSAKNHPVLKSTFAISEKEAKLFSAELQLNDNNVVADAVSAAVSDGSAAKEGYIHYTKKVEADTITFEPNLAEFAHMKRTSDGGENGGGNTLTIDVEANSRNRDSASEVFYVDDTAPIITEVTFSGTGRADAPQYVDANGNFVSVIKANDSANRNYGYYFKDATTIYVTATDFKDTNDRVVNGCNVKEIHVIKMPLGDVTAESGAEYDEIILSADSNDTSSSFTASFTVEADYKGKLFFYATDRVDNRSDNYNPDGAVVESLSKHNSTSSASIAVNTTPVAKDNNQHDLFNGNVSLKLTVSDTYSGILTASYNITSRWANGADLGSEKIEIAQTDTSVAGWTVEESEANSNLITRISKDITLDGAGIHNLNDIVIHLEATDRAGYPINCDDITLSIDTTAPTIVLTPREATHNTYAPESKDYYQEARTFDITVTERNFNPADFESASVITAREGDKPAFVGVSNWSTTYDDYTDASTHTATITFDTDGDYTVELNYKDEAGNSAESKKSDDFVIDKIDPTISVSFDGPAAVNGNYYSNARTATVTVTEHNFAEGSDYISFVADYREGDDTTPKSEPTLATSGWSSNGDAHSTTLTFDKDGHYAFTINYSDKAMRKATEYKEPDFYIDLKDTNGKIEFEVGYSNHAFGNQDVMPGITYTDNNLDKIASTYLLKRISYDPDNNTSDEKEIDDLIPNIGSEDSRTQMTVKFNDFPKEERYDGIYVLEAKLVDKAGNEFRDSIMFSVNRFGPTFMAGDSNTNRIVKSGYTNDVPDIRVTEINVEEIKSFDVTYTRDTEKARLQEGTGYKLTKTGSKETWYKYDFDVFKNNFTEEGSYTLTFTSGLQYDDDQYNTTVTNRTAKTDHGTYPVSFIYDNTAPDVTIEGVSNDSVHSEAEKNIKIICLDSNIDKDSLRITLNDKTLVLNTDYTVDDSLVGELDVDLPISAGLDEARYDLQVEVKDLANNDGTGEAKNFTLSATFFTLFFHNTLAVVLTSVGLAALVGLVIFLILKKRKKQE